MRAHMKIRLGVAFGGNLGLNGDYVSSFWYSFSNWSIVLFSWMKLDPSFEHVLEIVYTVYTARALPT
ncbi:unnamed protein product, partial [Symbiodinium sp. KB8]